MVKNNLYTLFILSTTEKCLVCAFLLLLGLIMFNYASFKTIIESYGGGRGGGRGRGGGIGRRGYGGHRYGGYGGGYYGGYGYNPVYIYNDSDYGYSYPYWYRYIPFLNSYY
jgi:uncharacterized membrane protein